MIKDLDNLLDTIFTVWSNAVANEASYQIASFATKCMEKYYGDYDPIYYDPRTNKMRNGSFKPFTRESGKGKGFSGGIEISSDFIEHNPKGVSESEIFNYVWNNNIHGFESVGYPDSYLRPIYGKKYGNYNFIEEIGKKMNTKYFQDACEKAGQKAIQNIKL